MSDQNARWRVLHFLTPVEQRVLCQVDDRDYGVCDSSKLADALDLPVDDVMHTLERLQRHKLIYPYGRAYRPFNYATIFECRFLAINKAYVPSEQLWQCMGKHRTSSADELDKVEERCCLRTFTIEDVAQFATDADGDFRCKYCSYDDNKVKEINNELKQIGDMLTRLGQKVPSPLPNDPFVRRLSDIYPDCMPDDEARQFSTRALGPHVQRCEDGSWVFLPATRLSDDMCKMWLESALEEIAKTAERPPPVEDRGALGWYDNADTNAKNAAMDKVLVLCEGANRAFE